MRSFLPVLAALLVSFPVCRGLPAAEKPTAEKPTAEKPTAEKPTAAKPAVVPVFRFRGPLSEAPQGDDLFLGAAGESFQQVIARLKKVRDDERVKAVVLLDSAASLGRAQLEEVRGVLEDIKSAGKPIYAHADSLGMADYTLTSVATRLSVVPSGDLMLLGLRADSLHLRGLLDLLGVTPDYLTCGQYKSAAETFTRREPSRQADENLNWLLDGIYDAQLRLIAEGRGVTVDKVQGWIDRGLFSAEQAAKLGVIDEVEYRDEFVARLKSEFGDDVEFDRRYGREKRTSINLSSPLGLLQFYSDLFTGGKPRKSTKDAVAIVYVEGPIMLGQSDPSGFPLPVSGIAYSTPIRKALERVAEDDTIKAAVLRVNSPGGSATGSEVILQATRLVKQKKPIVVSMGDVAGSGGYYVACGADTIFAEPSTMTGSIGVVGGKFATRQMWNRIGITWKEYQRGGSAGLLSTSRPFSDKERDLMQTWMDEIYAKFKQHVIDIRGDRLKKDLEELAGGRVYTGSQAAELGLVDKLGGLDDAIRHVAQQAQLETYEIRVVPRAKKFAELLLESLEEGDGQDAGQLLWRSVQSRPRTLTELLAPYLKGMDPGRAQMLRTGLLQLGVLQREFATLAMPLFRIH